MAPQQWQKSRSRDSGGCSKWAGWGRGRMGTMRGMADNEWTMRAAGWNVASRLRGWEMAD
jgi:hypothetical protein